MERNLLIILCLTVCKCFGSKILCVFSTPSFGHHVVYTTIAEELHRRGHELTILTTNPHNYTNPESGRINQIDLGPWSQIVLKSKLKHIELENYNGNKMFDTYYDTMLKITDAQLEVPQVKELLRNTVETFDLLIVEPYTPTWFALAEKFKVPIVSVSATYTTLQNFDSMDNPTHAFLYPDVLTSYSGKLSFFKRLILVYRSLQFRWNYYYNVLPKFEALAGKHFGNNSTPVGLMERRTDVLLVDAHPLFIGPMPTVPGVVFLGNIHIRAPNPIPDWLETFVNAKEKGFILFNLGANLLSQNLPLEKINVLTAAFSALDYNVIWKWENITLIGHPMNVLIYQWCPQSDILSHPKIRAFITQGGLRSVEEAIYHKVPVIGMPIVGDQHFNVARLVHLGVGVHLDYKTLSKESVLEAIQEVTTNDTYKNKITELSNMIRDDPTPPLEKAVRWIDYVLKYGDAKHLKTAAQHYSVYQILFLDIASFLLVVCICGLFCVHCILKKAKQKIFGPKASLVMYHNSKKIK